MTNRSRRSPLHHLLRLAPLAVLVVSAASCSSDAAPSADATAGTTVAPADAAPADDAAAATAAPSSGPAATVAPAPAAGSAICGTIPPLDAIAAALGEAPGAPAERGDDLIASCEVSSETGSVDFTRTDAATGQALIDGYRESGVLVEGYTDPAIPGASAGANIVQVIVGDTYYAVQVVTMASAVEPDTAAALAPSAALLAAWLELLA